MHVDSMGHKLIFNRMTEGTNTYDCTRNKGKHMWRIDSQDGMDITLSLAKGYVGYVVK